MSFGKYVKYKDSGIAWLGSVPGEWSIAPIKAVASCNDEVLPESTDTEAVIEYVEISGVEEGRGITETETLTFGAAPSRARRVVRHGDVLISTVRTYLRAIATVSNPPENLVASTGFAAIRPRCVDAGYLGYLLHAEYLMSEVIARSVGISYPAINASELMRLKAPIPPLQEQRAISAFLERETAKIDALVKEQKRLIELLKEKRQAVISQAVTKGLDPSVPMKDSGVEWLGEVPAHWTICTLRRLIRKIEQGWSPECEAQPADEEGWGVLKAGCVNRGVFNPDENKTLPESLSPVSDYEVRLGDILMSRASGSPELVGSTALVGNTRPRLMLSDKIFRIHLEPGQNSEFFVWTMNAKYMREQIEQALSGGNGLANNLPQSVLLSFKCAVPPEKEQVAVGERLNQEVIKLDHLLGEAASSIDLLNERRAALISAAVTGKIDVRSNDSGANLPSRGRGHTK